MYSDETGTNPGGPNSWVDSDNVLVEEYTSLNCI